MTKNKPKHRREGIAFGTDGKPMPLTSDAVNQTIDTSWEDPESRLVLAILQTRQGDLMINIMGRPSHKVLDLLEQTTETYRKIVKDFKDGHA